MRRMDEELIKSVDETLMSRRVDEEFMRRNEALRKMDEKLVQMRN